MTKPVKQIIFFTAIIVLALSLFIFRHSIFRGTLLIHAAAPYNVEIIGEQNIHCENDPCEISLTAGVKDIVLTKPLHRSIIITANISTFQTSEENITFRILPQLADAESLPVANEANYDLSIDDTSGMQKLLKEDDPAQQAIVFFPRTLTNPQLYSSNQQVLIVSDSGNYAVDVKKNSRRKIDLDLSIIKEGEWSLEGDYFVFEHSISGALWILDVKNDQLLPLDLYVGLDQVDWVATNRLVFASNQSFSEQGRVGNYLDTIKLNPQKSSSILFGAYLPAANLYQKISSFSQITTLPTAVNATASGSEIYFKNDDKISKVVVGL